MNVLVVAAHPDDEVLGCGATVAALARKGHTVQIAILGEGETSRGLRRDEVDPAAVQALAECTREAARRLGAAEPKLFGLPDNRFDTVAMLDVVKVVEALIAECRPGVVYTHHGGDLNVDHQVVHRAVLTATRPVDGCPVRDVYAFEVPSATDWALGQLEPRFRANVFVDVSRTLALKIDAMAAYPGESRTFPHPRSPEALRASALRWGSVAGVDAAEAFELVRSIRRPGEGIPFSQGTEAWRSSCE